ncbi:MAG: ferritin [Microbacter sp.]
MINKEIEKKLNKQINLEFWSSQLYLSMSAYFSAKGLQGFAHWMFVQYQEEVTHALKFFNYLIERGGRVNLMPIASVNTEWASTLDVFLETQTHEKEVTEKIYQLADLAVVNRDHATQSMLRWFIDEQVEEEANVQAIIDKLNLVKDNGHAIYSIDKELSVRVFVDGTQTPQ